MLLAVHHCRAYLPGFAAEFNGGDGNPTTARSDPAMPRPRKGTESGGLQTFNGPDGVGKGAPTYLP